MHVLSLFCWIFYTLGFPDSSVGKEYACNAEDPVQFLGQEDPLEKGQATHPVFLGSPVAQLVKNPPAMRETWVQSLVWEDPLEKRKATHSRILAWRIPWTVLFMYYLYSPGYFIHCFNLCALCSINSKI